MNTYTYINIHIYI